jgi:hypothetical protein
MLSFVPQPNLRETSDRTVSSFIEKSFFYADYMSGTFPLEKTTSQ